ncbi:MAG TPA: helix-turn-helix transcriptional regulator [Candidatus Butyricicoccus stercorigallinarum]|nr:helix-turn-helix transcriptional regulator [Candidatus Butyricicoccus stercorigallinarum]
MKCDVNNIPYDCPIEATLGLIGGKWKALILDHLTEGALRFGELQKKMPKITPKMLTQQLRELETDGLIVRRAYPVVPPRVEYELTEFGQTVLPILDAMCAWGRVYLDAVRAQQETPE